MVRTPVFLFVFVCVSACSFRDTPEDWREWYDEGTDVAVEEPIAYTTENYDLVGETPISGLPRPGDFQTLFAPDDAPPTRLCSGWRTDDALPVTISGVVTIHPRFYIKVSGCRAAESFSVEADEKYFGSFYLQDATGGFLVLGDTKVADFSVGDRVTLNVRAVKNFFDQDMIAAHDVVEIVRGPAEVYYEPVQGRLLGTQDLGSVKRIQGTVAAPMSNFGEVYLCTGANPDTTLVRDENRFGDLVPACAHSDVVSPPWFKVGIDVELQRRGVDFEVGSTLQATGPVHLGFGDHQVVVMELGQYEVLD